jgi:hypothetical protein
MPNITSHLATIEVDFIGYFIGAMLSNLYVIP